MLDRAIVRGLDSLSGLTGMSYSLYDDKQNLLASSSSQDKLLATINSKDKLLAVYKEFLERQLKLSILRQDPFFVQGVTGQYHAFIPLNCAGKVMTVVAETFYTSKSDFKRFFFSEYRRATGILNKTEEDWLKDIKIYSHEEIKSILEHARTILQSLIAAEMANDRLNKYFQQSKTIISIMSDINTDYSVRNIYQIVIDSIIFLFEIDTAAFFLKKYGQYKTEAVEGRHSQLIQGMRLSADNRLIVKGLSDTASFTVMDDHELLHAGFPERINHTTLFPFYDETGEPGLLAVFNSQLDKEVCDSISNLCKLTACLCGIRRQREELELTSDRLQELSVQASSLYSFYQERDRLYEGIVSEAANLAGAEKCSLMMPHDGDMLEVRASKGFNRWLMNNVKIRKGEGIAGKVYEKGMPVLLNGEDSIRNFGTAPRSHYKTMSALSLPLKIADEIIGVLNLSDKCSGISFAKNDISTLSPFMLQASTLLKLCLCNEMMEEMKKLSMTDSLTGLFNRRYFDIRLEEEYLRAKRYNIPMSLAILDLDDFKPFNDSEGHLAGDTILKEVAYAMSSAVRSHDILTRFGGEEYAIIMPQTPQAEAFGVSERIRNNIKQNIKPTWHKYYKKYISISGGVATYPDCCKTKEDIIMCADRALYQAKRRGKDMTVLWEEPS